MDQMEFDFLEEQELSSVTLGDLQILIKKMFDVRAQVEDLEDQKKAKNAELEILKDQVQKILQAHDRTSLDVPGVGNVYVSKKMSVSYPKDPEQAAKVRAWLESKGMTDLLTVNSQTLNSVYKDLAAEYEGQGYLPEQIIPGIGEPKIFETVNMRKGK